MRSVNKVVFNTLILYTRMLISICISLYSTRLILNVLGVTDFGIFNLIAGVIAMLSFLNAAMTTSTQRYLSYHQGVNNLLMQKKIFTNSFVLHIIIGLIVIIGLQLGGVFLFSGFLNIPEARLHSAKIIYQFMTVSVFFTIVGVPFTGSLNAHENMLWIAIVNIIESASKLGIAIVLLNSSQDKLILYGLLTACSGIVSFILYSTYCLFKYNECTFKNLLQSIDLSLLKELASFAGWNLFGALCGLGRNEGIAIILNLYLGATINAAYGIAFQVAAQLNFFSAVLLQALNPQIMKSEGAKDRAKMLRLAMVASKFGFFLLAIIAIPCIFEMKEILVFWLKNVPAYTVVFCILILISNLINQLTIGLQSAFQATGNVRVYQAVVGSIVLLNVPISLVFLKLGFSAYYAILSVSIVEIFACCFRLYFLKKQAGLSISEYFSKVILREITPVLVAVALCFIVTTYMDFNFRFIFTIGLSAIAFAISIYFTGLYSDEKLIIDEFYARLRGRFRKRNAVA